MMTYNIPYFIILPIFVYKIIIILRVLIIENILYENYNLILIVTNRKYLN